MTPEASSVEPTTPNNPRTSQGCDVDAIRQALVAYNNWEGGFNSPDRLLANAPVWLAQLCDEVERLRAVDERLREGIDVVTAQRDAALAKLDGYRSDHAALMGERNAALAECERLRRTVDRHSRAFDKSVNESARWRACADQLAEAGTTGDNWDDAMAVYEQLKATS